MSKATKINIEIDELEWARNQVKQLLDQTRTRGLKRNFLVKKSERAGRVLAYERVLQKLDSRITKKRIVAESNQHSVRRRKIRFTDHDREVMQFLADGKSSRDMAEIWTIEARSARKAIASVLKKAGMEREQFIEQIRRFGIEGCIDSVTAARQSAEPKPRAFGSLGHVKNNQEEAACNGA